MLQQIFTLSFMTAFLQLLFVWQCPLCMVELEKPIAEKSGI